MSKWKWRIKRGENGRWEIYRTNGHVMVFKRRTFTWEGAMAYVENKEWSRI